MSIEKSEKVSLVFAITLIVVLAAIPFPPWLEKTIDIGKKLVSLTTKYVVQVSKILINAALRIARALKFYEMFAYLNNSSKPTNGLS